jgi:hypothetical protein
MSRIICVITGCGISCGAGYAWGDLHMVEDTLIFNAVLDSSGNTKWDFEKQNLERLRDRPLVTLRPEANYFERRGVIIFSREEAQFNAPATNKLNYVQ